MTPVAPVAVRAPAKVNLSLLVGPPDQTGYHELFTVFLPITLYDELEFSLEVTPGQSDRRGLVVECDGLQQETNLVTRALRAVEQETGWSLTGVVTLRKHIPMAAGLGGGSSDAATALRVAAQAVEEAGGPHVGDRRLRELARALGADVPFFLDPTPSIARGIGDLLEPIALPPVSLVLLVDKAPLATRDVYRTFDTMRALEDAAAFAQRSRDAEDRWREVSNLGNMVRLLQNDLEEAGFGLLRALVANKEMLVTQGAVGALMSGSGPTLFGLCSSPEQAQAVGRRLEEAGRECRVAATHGG